MIKHFRDLPKRMRVFLAVISILVSIPLGAIAGAILGLVSTTFIPLCCDGGGCHNCLEFNGMVGYEAAAFLGFWLGAVLAPMLYILFLIYFKTKK